MIVWFSLILPCRSVGERRQVVGDWIRYKLSELIILHHPIILSLSYPPTLIPPHMGTASVRKITNSLSLFQFSLFDKLIRSDR